MESSNMKSCAVPGCINTTETSPDVHLFPFPVNSNRCLQWLLMVNRKDLVSQMTEILNKNYTICSIHFTPNSFVKNHRKLLKVSSVPTLHLNKDVSLGEVDDADCPTNITESLQDGQFSECAFEELLNSSNRASQIISEELHMTKQESSIVLNICRLCSVTVSDVNSMFNIFDTSNIYDQINICLPVEVSKTDPLPKSICFQCLNQLQKHLKFHQTVLNSDSVLKEMLFTGEINQSVHNDHIYAEIISEENKELDEPLIIPISETDDLIDHSLNNFSDEISENIIVESVEQVMDDVNIFGILKNEGSFDDRMLILDNTMMYMCNLCHILTSDIEYLYTHSVSDHSTVDGNCVCVLCHSLEQFTKEELVSHMNLHISSEGLPDVDNSQPDQSITSSIEIHNNFIKGLYLCGFCNKRFKSKHRMEFHMKFHMGDEPGMCYLCNKRFTDENLLYRHVWYLHRGGRARRALASSKSKKVTKNRRTKRAANTTSIFCTDCGINFDKPSAKLIHEENVHKMVRYCYQCHHCMEAFADTLQLLNHTSNEHGYTAPLKQETKTIMINCLYQCEYCSKLYTKISCLDNHRQVHHNKNPVFTCRYCLQECSTFEDFLSHIVLRSEYTVSHNKDDYPKRPIAKRLYCCQYCSKTFQLIGKLLAHVEKHKSGMVEIDCKACGIKLASTAEADIHKANSHPILIEERDPNRPHTCKHCPKTFASEAALIKHTRIHTGERPYGCDFCGKYFSQSSGLITHTKTHTDERPYSCSHCKQSFKIKADYDNHIRKHSGERPYKCETCNKTFMTQHVYSQHRKIHTDYRPYVCKICGDAFRRSHVLNVHVLRHSGAKPHACSMCDKHYRQRGDLLKHMKAQHGITSKNSPSKYDIIQTIS